MKKFQIWNVYSLTEKNDYSCVCVDDIKLAGKNQNIGPPWEILMKDVDLGEPTSLLDDDYLVCTRRKCQINKDSVTITGICSNPGFLPEPWKNYRPELQRNWMQKQYFHDMEGHAKRCVERNCELANKTNQQFYKVATPCMDDHQFEEEEK